MALGDDRRNTINDTDKHASEALSRVSEGFCPRTGHHGLAWDGHCRLCRTWWLIDVVGPDPVVKVEARWAQRVDSGISIRVASHLISDARLHSPTAQDELTYGVIQVKEKIRMIALGT